MNSQSKHWQRAIALLDMNAFFASIEQRDFPSLLGQPVAITNGLRGSCIITCSYEARALGIHTGMRLRQAQQLCPDLIQRPTRPKVYAKVSRSIMRSLTNVCPDIEVFSVDEAFIDLTSCQKLYGSPEQGAHKLKQTVYRASGLLCSLGLSGDKTTAKYAAKLNKPDGFTVIPPWQAKATLQHVAVTELCGIGKGIGNFLSQYGVHYCGDMEKLPISVLSQRFGNLGRRIWYMCQGADPDPLHPDISAAKTIGHGKVLPPNTRDRNTLLIYLQHMSSKVASRMRRFDMQAKTFWIGLRTHNGWLGSKSRLAEFSNDQQKMYQLSCDVLDLHWTGQGIHQVQVTALDPRPADMQMQLFSTDADNKFRQQLNKVTDNINERYGELTLSPARLLNRSDMPNVIAPAWKPDGLRQTISPGYPGLKYRAS